VINRIKRVKYGKWVLEDGLYFAPKGKTLSTTQLANVFPLVEDLTFGRINEAQQQHCQRGLATATLSCHRHNRRFVFFE